MIAIVGTAGSGGTGITLTSPLTKAHASGAGVIDSLAGFAAGQTITIGPAGSQEDAVIASVGTPGAAEPVSSSPRSSPRPTWPAPAIVTGTTIKVDSTDDLVAGHQIVIDTGLARGADDQVRRYRGRRRDGRPSRRR